MDAIDFRRVRNVLQPILMGTIVTPKATHEVLVLSDSGSTVGFTVKSFMATIGVIPSGLWRGHLETAMRCATTRLTSIKSGFSPPMAVATAMCYALRPPHSAKETLFLMIWLRMSPAPSKLQPLRSSQLVGMSISSLARILPPSYSTDGEQGNSG